MATLQFIIGLGFAVVGAAHFVAGLTLYFDDDGKLQSRLQDLLTECWSSAEAAQESALRFESRLLGVVMTTVSRFFDQVFGERLISTQALGVSLCFSLVSLGVTLVAIAASIESQYQYVLPLGALTAAFAAAGLSRRIWARNMACACVLCVCALVFLNVMFAPEPRILAFVKPEIAEQTARLLMDNACVEDEILRLRSATDAQLFMEGYSTSEIRRLRQMNDLELKTELEFTEGDINEFAGVLQVPLAEALARHSNYQRTDLSKRAFIGSIFGLPVILAVLSDILVVFFTRLILRTNVESRSAMKAVGIAVCCVFLAAAFFVTPIALTASFAMPYAALFGILAMMNWSTALIACSWFLLITALLLHRVLWPYLVGYLDSQSTAEKASLRTRCFLVGGASLGLGCELMNIHWISPWVSSVTSLL